LSYLMKNCLGEYVKTKTTYSLADTYEKEMLEKRN